MIPGKPLTSRAAAMLLGLLLVAVLAACGEGDEGDGGNNVGGSSSAPLTVQTQKGKVAGVTKGPMRAFLGVPYAAPPVGKLRWRPPQPAQAWSTTLAAKTFAPHCPQIGTPFGQASMNEDCLYLNVFAPKDQKTHPVMVWIHGGALAHGESDDYDPRLFVQRGVVVVTINYRLGLLGFLALPSLTAESPSDSDAVDYDSGNYGLLDQQAALRWVQRNIARFGGNPQNVTIFGESAGGLSVLAQLVSPTAKGLFQKAIVESGSYAPKQSTLSQGESQGHAFAKKVGCPDATPTCLRSLPVKKVLNNQGGLISGFGLKANTKTLPQSILTAIKTGNFHNNVPVMEGTNRNESRLFTAIEHDLLSAPVTAKAYRKNRSQAIRNVYPLADYASPDLASAAVDTDSTFACPGRREVRALSNQGVRTYAYEFDDPNAPEDFLPTENVTFPFGSAHASEIQYLFRTFDRQKILANASVTLSPSQKKLSTKMVGYWSQFAKSGNPNASSGVAQFWPRYTNASHKYLSLMPPNPKPITDFGPEHHCGFWDNAG